MKRLNRYVVLKRKDIEKYLSMEQKTILERLCCYIVLGRHYDNRPVLKTVVVESDWPEYEPVWKMIEDRVDNVQENKEEYVKLSDVVEAFYDMKKKCFNEHPYYQNALNEFEIKMNNKFETDINEKEYSPYGYCPYCGEKGYYRERRLLGNDKCLKGHVYPSKNALYEKD